MPSCLGLYIEEKLIKYARRLGEEVIEVEKSI